MPRLLFFLNSRSSNSNYYDENCCKHVRETIESRRTGNHFYGQNPHRISVDRTIRGDPSAFFFSLPRRLFSGMLLKRINQIENTIKEGIKIIQAFKYSATLNDFVYVWPKAFVAWSGANLREKVWGGQLIHR